MKKIIALSLLSSLVGCAQLMPPKIPLQTPVETINTTKATDVFIEPVIVAELDSSVKTDPLYQSSDSIAVSEQAITEPVINETLITELTAEVEATETKATVNTEVNTSAETAESQTVELNVVEAEPVVNDAVVTEPAVVEPQAIEAEPVVNDTEITEPTSEPASEVVPVAETPIVEDISQTTDDSYKTVDMHGYSLQITASRDEQSLVTLLSSLASQQPAWVNRKMLNGSQAYTLLVGHYADYDQAKAALALLPQVVQQNGAFVRNFYDIEHTGSPQLKLLQ